MKISSSLVKEKMVNLQAEAKKTLAKRPSKKFVEEVAERDEKGQSSFEFICPPSTLTKLSHQEGVVEQIGTRIPNYVLQVITP